MELGLVNHLKQQSPNFFDGAPLSVKHFLESVFSMHVPFINMYNCTNIACMLQNRDKK